MTFRPPSTEVYAIQATMGPLVVQPDRTILVEIDHPDSAAARDRLLQFAELEKSPEHVHTYRLTPLSLWHAAAAGWQPQQVSDALQTFARYGVPGPVAESIREWMGRYGRVRVDRAAGPGAGPLDLVLACDDAVLLQRLAELPEIALLLGPRGPDGRSFQLRPGARGPVKQALARAGYPPLDLAGYHPGAPLPIRLRGTTAAGLAFRLRPYQAAAVDAFYRGGSARGGQGIVALPCGAGKTVVGIGAMAATGAQTLIVTANTVAVRQWMAELLDKAEIDPADVGEYTGERKQVRPVTVTTYQMLTHRTDGGDDAPQYAHLELFTRRDWGLVIYDEVHLLPAPVFRITAEIQALRRLGLTATLVREDGREVDAFALVGPKRFDMPWKELERQGWIAPAVCHEVRVELPAEGRLRYAATASRDQFRIAAENPGKLPVVTDLLALHRGEPALVIGQYLDQLRQLAAALSAPLITGQTPSRAREDLYGRFRRGELPVLIVSKVANFAIDLPDASVLVQVSGTFGSRQEEAQRLGRILRPKRDGGQAHFYTLVSADTCELRFAQKRQLFLTEQGYRYEIADAAGYRRACG